MPVDAADTPEPPARAAYPPDRHVLRDLQVTGTHRAGRRWSEIPVVPAILDAGGAPSTGVLGILVDVAAGSTAVVAAIPDWCATASLDLRLRRPAADHGRLRAEATVLRKGSTTVVVEVAVVDAGSEVDGPCAWSSLIFSIMPRRAGNLTMRDEEGEFPMGLPTSGFTTAFAEAVGLVVDDAAAGRVELPITDAARNSFGALQGGLQVVAADAAAAAAGGHRLGAPVRTTDLAVTYLAQGKLGPVTTTADLLRADGDGGGAVWRVEVRDAGTDRLMSVATATTAPLPGV